MDTMMTTNRKLVPQRGMVPGLDTNVLHRQRQSRLIAENGLVLRTVVAEHPVYVLLSGAEDHVRQQHQDLDHTLDQVMECRGRGMKQPPPQTWAAA